MFELVKSSCVGGGLNHHRDKKDRRAAEPDGRAVGCFDVSSPVVRAGLGSSRTGCAIVATSGSRNTVYGFAPGIGCAEQWLASLKATDGGDEENGAGDRALHMNVCPGAEVRRRSTGSSRPHGNHHGVCERRPLDSRMGRSVHSESHERSPRWARRKRCECEGARLTAAYVAGRTVGFTRLPSRKPLDRCVICND